MDPSTIVAQAKRTGGFQRWIDLVRQVMIAQHKYPEGSRSAQQTQIQCLTRSFQALLKAKATQESIQKIRQNNRRQSNHCSTCPTDDATSGVGVGNILKKQVTGRRKRKNGSRQKEGYIESCLGKHVTKGW